MLSHYEAEFPEFPSTAITHHVGVNSSSVTDLIQRERPDIVLISGTDLLKPTVIQIIAETGRIMNLHTGISPYIKGGPNCTNWALALREFHLIGNTLMWLDEGIDSGNIIVTERTPLTGRETLTELHIRVMDHAHDLYSRGLARIRDGLPLASVRQSNLGEGRLFLTRNWTGQQITKATFNFFRFYNPEALSPAPPKLVPLVPNSPLA
jgi:methionyl-tRNA formyltransferase